MIIILTYIGPKYKCKKHVSYHCLHALFFCLYFPLHFPITFPLLVMILDKDVKIIAVGMLRRPNLSQREV
jgi:hypothetical protein